MDDGGGAVRPVMGGERCRRLPELLDRQEDAEGRVGPGDPVELLLLGERRPSRGPGEDDRLGDFRGGQLRLECGRRGLEGAHPRADVVGYPQGVEGVHLLADCPVDRGVARVEADDVDPPLPCVLVDDDDLVQGHPRRVVAFGLGRDEGQHPGAHERARVDADPAGREQPRGLQRQELRIPRARADEMDDHLSLLQSNHHDSDIRIILLDITLFQLLARFLRQFLYLIGGNIQVG